MSYLRENIEAILLGWFDLSSWAPYLLRKNSILLRLMLVSLVEIPVCIGFSYMVGTHCCVLEY